MKKNSLDLNDVKPECIEVRDDIVRTEKKIRLLKEEYEIYNKKFMLSRQDSTDKSDLGYELYRLNIHAISLIQKLALCQEGRNVEMI